MKNLNQHSIISSLPVRPSLIEFRGHRIPLPGICSGEPLLRGCDQREWLHQLAELGIRHLVIPLNGEEEDTCLFARRHPEPRAAGSDVAASAVEETAGNPPALYDLDHRDEGVFTRLQFLLNTAEEMGVMVGLSLFDISPAAVVGPLNARNNVQGLSPADAVRRGSAAASQLEKLRERLLAAALWIAAELRGRETVWVEIFRGPDSTFSRLELDLTRQMAAALAKPGEAARDARLGPWLAAPPGFDWKSADAAHAAPFDIHHGMLPERTARLPQADDANLRPVEAERRCALYHFMARPSGASGKRGGAPESGALWRSVMRGFWPIVPASLNDHPSQRVWMDLSQIARFALQWAGQGYLRAAPEVLAPMPRDSVVTGRLAAATDGAGRCFIYAGGKLESGIVVSVLPGGYRWYWIDPLTGRAMDHGDGLEGGAHCSVPGYVTAEPAVLILEEEELPDPMSVW